MALNTNRPRARGAPIAARIAGIASHLPQATLTNAELAAQFPGWSEDKIRDKTGISERRIAAVGETALDLAEIAVAKLFGSGVCQPDEIDFVILVTQAPDYILPTSACLLQARLGLSTAAGALDVNLGCSGYVYGLSLAAGLIASGQASNVLLVTADTYSKYIHPRDKSVRTLFGDAAAATLVRADEDSGSSIGPFLFGTDGAGAGDLIVEAGGFRTPRDVTTGEEISDTSGNVRTRNHLHMNGGAVLTFSLREVPQTFNALLEATNTTIDDYRHIVLHQANQFMLDALQKKLRVPDAKLPRYFEQFGNTVSSSIPLVLESLVASGGLVAGDRIMLIGFGVGLSWAGACLVY